MGVNIHNPQIQETDKEPMTVHLNDSTKVQLGKSMGVLGLLTGESVRGNLLVQWYIAYLGCARTWI